MRIRATIASSLIILLYGACAMAQGRGRLPRGAGMAQPRPQGIGGSARVRAMPSPVRSTRPWSSDTRAYHHLRNCAPRLTASSGFRHRPYGNYGYSPYFAQASGWPGYYRSPYLYPSYYSYPSYFPYLYFYELYYKESLRSKQEADEFEAAFAREKRGESPATPGASTGPKGAKSEAHDPNDVPIAPRNARLTVDGQEVTPSVSGMPLVLGSGHHTFRISANQSVSGEATAPSPQHN